jgi:choline-glycine betaine transporter
MKSSNYGLFAVAAAVVFVGVLLAGVPLETLALLLILLACPLMMIFMMKGMHGGGNDHTGHDHDHPSTRP